MRWWDACPGTSEGLNRDAEEDVTGGQVGVGTMDKANTRVSAQIYSLESSR